MNDELKPEEAKEFLISIGKYDGTIYDQPTPLYDAQGTRMRLKAVQAAFKATSNIIGVIAITAIGSIIINTIKNGGINGIEDDKSKGRN